MQQVWDYLVEPFEITMHPRERKNTVKFRVDILYHSEVLIKFRLSGGHKILEMQKDKLESNQFKAWKILYVNFAIEATEAASWNLTELRRLIDEKITGKSRMTYRNPGERISQ